MKILKKYTGGGGVTEKNSKEQTGKKPPKQTTIHNSQKEADAAGAAWQKKGINVVGNRFNAHRDTEYGQSKDFWWQDADGNYHKETYDAPADPTTQKYINMNKGMTGMIAKAVMSAKGGKMENGGFARTVNKLKTRFDRFRQKRKEKPMSETRFYEPNVAKGGGSGYKHMTEYGNLGRGISALMTKKSKNPETFTKEDEAELKRMQRIQAATKPGSKESVRDIYLEETKAKQDKSKMEYDEKMQKFKEEDEAAKKKRKEGSEKVKQTLTPGRKFVNGGNVKVKIPENYGVDAEKELDFLKNVDQGVKQEKPITLEGKSSKDILTKKNDTEDILIKKNDTGGKSPVKEDNRGNYRGGSNIPQVVRDKDIVRNKNKRQNNKSSNTDEVTTSGDNNKMTSSDRVEKRSNRKDYRRAMRKYRQEMRQYNRTMRRKGREERRENRGMTYTQGRRISPRRWFKNLRDKLGARYLHEGRAKGYRDFNTSRTTKPVKPVKNFKDGGKVSKYPGGGTNFMKRPYKDGGISNDDFLKKNKVAKQSSEMKKHLKFIKDRDEAARKIKQPAKGGAKKLTKSQIAKILAKKGGKALLKSMGYVGIALTASDVAKKVAPATKPALKKRAEKGNYNMGRKI